jgi:2-oxoglutarate ferredoxin oxidoreductase subunit beta
MSTAAAPPKKVNRIGLEVLSYKGAKTTLCAGCGHNAISERIIECFFEMGIRPWQVAAGIGKPSNRLLFFEPGMFNAVHGRSRRRHGCDSANHHLPAPTVTGDGTPHPSPRR